MAGEAEENVVTPKVEPAVNNTPSPAPKDDANVKPVPEQTPEQIEAAKAAEAAEAAKKAKEQEPTTEDDDEDDPQNWKDQYIEFEDPAAQSVVNLLNEAGVKPVEANAIFEEALKADDISKIKWDVLEARLGKDKANLAKIGITDYYNREYSKNVATTNMVHEQVGGKENWQKVAKWVQKAERADPTRKAEFDELRKGIDLGGRYAKQAVADLKALYEADGKNSGLGTGKIIKGDQPPKGGLEPLSRAEYTAELRKHGDRINPTLYAELQHRRKLGMQAERGGR